MKTVLQRIGNAGFLFFSSPYVNSDRQIGQSVKHFKILSITAYGVMPAHEQKRLMVTSAMNSQK